jgi:hypothetical protein
VIGTVTFGLQELTALMEKLCLRANKNIRLFVHALGVEYKLPDQFAHKLAAYIKQREDEGTPVRLWPVIVVDKSITPTEFTHALSSRAAIYAQHGVADFAKPRFLKTDSPMGIDVLVVDDGIALLSLTTAFGSTQTQVCIAFEHHAKLLAEFIDWFDRVVGARALTWEEFQASMDTATG